MWYTSYDKLRAQVDESAIRFAERCWQLGTRDTAVQKEYVGEIIARAIHESNWQEGIELSVDRTQELSAAAFDDVESIMGPHLDMSKISRVQRDEVVKLKRKGASSEEIAAYNLAWAHKAVQWVADDLYTRHKVGMWWQFKSVELALSDNPIQLQDGVLKRLVDGVTRRSKNKTIDQKRKSLQVAREMLSEFDEVESESVERPMTPPVENENLLLKSLRDLDPVDFLLPMKADYIQFLHKTIMMGILPINKCGKFRAKSVHVGHPDVLFPVPSAVAGLINEYCNSFPVIWRTASMWHRHPKAFGFDEYESSSPMEDEIMLAASASHRFVAIHPFEDGNGRASRLLMNLVLVGHKMPPVYLKADKKGRHRYTQALRRADRGNIEPLACLIAMSLIDVYEKMLKSLNSGGGPAKF